MMVDVELEIDAGVVQGVIDSNVVVCIRDRSRLRNLLTKSPGFERMDGRSRRLDKDLEVINRLLEPGDARGMGEILRMRMVHNKF